nr:hypothetical protein [Tanacetum cinerariifolium]
AWTAMPPAGLPGRRRLPPGAARPGCRPRGRWQPGVPGPRMPAGGRARPPRSTPDDDR